MRAAAWAQGPIADSNQFDPPSSVARLNLVEGAVGFAPVDTPDAPDAYGRSAWTAATLNRPLTTGDRLWSGQRARSELHIGSSAVRMNEQTSLDFMALDDRLTQLHLTQGSLQLRVRTLFEGQRMEVDTPHLAFVISRPGNYRVDVNPARDTTRVVALSGAGVVYGDSGAPLNLGSQQQLSVTGINLTPAAPGATVQDGFDAWALARDQSEDQSVAARYVPRETVGYQQLDTYGDWRQDARYGAVWLPRAVPVNWAPYRAGHWRWIAPWGWTWIDDAPWGFAPFHYGRWAQIGPRWAWVPGQLAASPVYAPALVAFIGGGEGGLSWNLSIGYAGAPQPSVGWFPLAPGEAYRPAYQTSPHYLTQINNNIVVNNTLHVTPGYRYQLQPTAVTALSSAAFSRGQSVSGNQQPLSADDLGRARLMTGSASNRSTLQQSLDRRALQHQNIASSDAALPPTTVSVARPGTDNQPTPVDARRGKQPPNLVATRRHAAEAVAPIRADATQSQPHSAFHHDLARPATQQAVVQTPSPVSAMTHQTQHSAATRDAVDQRRRVAQPPPGASADHQGSSVKPQRPHPLEERQQNRQARHTDTARTSPPQGAGAASRHRDQENPGQRKNTA